MSNLPSSVRLSLFIGVTIVSALIFVFLPRRISFILFTVLVIYPVLTAVVYYLATTVLHWTIPIGGWLAAFLFTSESPDLNTRKLRPIHTLEIVVIILMSIFAARHHYDFHPDMRVRGQELEWLTGSGQLAHQSLTENGYIPLWNPYYRQGEPLVDNAFSYLLNPFSSVPHLLMGSTQGTKYAITINVGLAAVGGWFLGWVLGLSGAGRLTLALLMLSKGNIHANFDGGYYQLATQQVYFPWIFAGMIALFKTTKRWAVMLTAVSATMMFFAGNLWHVLPTVISMFMLFLLYGRKDKQIDFVIVRRLVLVTLITIGLSAVTLLSIGKYYGLIDAHPDEFRAGWEVLEPNRTYLLPFIADYKYATEDLLIIVPKSEIIRIRDISRLSRNGAMHFYYSYVSPWWFVLLILVPVPFMWRYRKTVPENRRLWIAGFALYVFFTMWGMGGTPLFRFLYDTVPYLAQWRFVPRALGMASFWIAVLVALRLDTLLRTLWMRWQDVTKTDQPKKQRATVYVGLIVFYVVLSGFSILHVTEQWQNSPMVHMEPQFKRCMEWLDGAEPDQEHSVWIHGYDRMTDVLKNDIRMINIEADFLPSTEANTIGDPRIDSRMLYSGERMLQRLDLLDHFVDEGYAPNKEAPAFHRIEHCIYENEDYNIPYAFTFALEDATIEFPSDKRHEELMNLYMADLDVSPVIGFERLYDTIAVRVQSDSQNQQVLAIQELAFPGWEVWVDGERQPNDIFAKWNAVKLPLDDEIHDVVFMYRPPLVYIGALITILTVIASVIYLLRLDRFFPKRNTSTD